MPRRPSSTCGNPNCPTLVKPGTGAYCPEHAQARQRADQLNRGTAAYRGYDARHRKWRKMVLARHPLCLRCQERGQVTPATVADHITPLDELPPPCGHWSLSNGQGLCHSCHNAKTAEDKRP